MNFKLIVILIMIIDYLYGIAQTLLEWRSFNNPIPENVKDIYDQETYQKWRSYHAENCRLSLISETFSFLISMLLIVPDTYARFARLVPLGDFIQMFALILLDAVTTLLTLPISWYDTMVLEEKYGFNRTDKKTFWLDTLKSFLISLALMVLLGSLLMWAHKKLGDWMIVVFAAIVTLLTLALAFLSPILSKIFNKFTPLEDSELKEKLTALLEKHGYHVRAIQVMDGSRRSTRSNAYFTGFGKMKTIVLYDTLVQSMTTDEICAVFAHELGHGLHKDTLKNQIFSTIQILIMAVFAWLTLRTPEVFTAFGFSGINYGFAMGLIGIELSVLSPLLSLLVNAYSRRAEYAADRQAVLEGYGPALISGLKKLSRENFSNLAPDPFLVKISYSHPPVSQRVSAIEREIAKL